MRATGIEIVEDGQAVCLTFADGQTSRFHALWLRDNALDPKTRNAANGQRLITVLDIPRSTAIASAEILASGDIAMTFRPENHTTMFPVCRVAPTPGFARTGALSANGSRRCAATASPC